LARTESSYKPDAEKLVSCCCKQEKEVREVYKTLAWATEGDKDKFDKVLETFERFCSPQKNILYECCGFWSLHQEEGKTIDAYMMRLKLKIDSCEYDKTGWPAAVKAEMTRDKFVFGLIDDVLKERLLHEVDLTFECTVLQTQCSESSKAHAKEMSIQAKFTLQCDAVKQLWRSDNTGMLFMCRQCGRQHRPRECAAYGQQCSACHKLHHFAKMCRSKEVSY